MNYKLLITVYIMISLSVFISGQFHVSVESIKQALRIDLEISNHLTKISPQFSEEQVLLKKYLDEHNRMKENYGWKSDSVTDSNLEDVAKNPIQAYQVLRRLSLDYTAFSKKIIKTIPKKLKKSVSMIGDSLHSFSQSLIFIQTTHQKLFTKDLRIGRIRHLQTLSNLTVKDCLSLSTVAKHMQAFKVAFHWAQQGHQLCKTDFEKLSSENQAKNPRLCQRTSQPVYIGAKVNLDRWHESGGIIKRPNSLCSKATFGISKKGRISKNLDLKCRVHRQSDCPLLSYEEEEQMKQPLIKTYCGVITPREAQHIKSQAKLYWGQNVPYGKAVYLSKYSDKLITRITNKLEKISGLKINDYEVMNYGTGGSYNSSMNETKGKHLTENFPATLIIHLSDVEIGGAEEFPAIKLTINPKQGCITLISHTKDKSLFRSCPVIFGSKWVAYSQLYQENI